ncbi:MAG: hypothetical protein HZA91_01520 [Verrucomicrobia bacterium]|nr:hypothetical protein [Verrucomicrobiota bacterium]
MNSDSTYNLTFYSILFVGGVFILATPFTAWSRNRPRWIRVALWMSGLITLSWSLLGYTLMFAASSFSQHGYYFARSIEMRMSGAAIALLLLLVLSGEKLSDFGRTKS